MAIIAPLIIGFVFIAIVVAIIIKRNMNKNGRRNDRQKVKWMFGGYVLVLFLATILAEFLLPHATSSKLFEDSHLEKKSDELRNLAYAGEIDKIPSEYLRKKWSIGYDKEELKLASNSDGSRFTNVVIERKSVHDHKIEVFYYHIPSEIEKLDLNEKLKPIEIKKDEQALEIQLPETVDISMSNFEKEFTIRQFTGEKWTDLSTSSFVGDSLIYIKIPRMLDITDETNMPVDYVGM